MVSSVFRHLVCVSASICCVLQSLQQYCCGCQGLRAVFIQWYTLSVHALFHHVPVFCLLFLIAWDSCPEDSISWCFLPSNLTAGFLLQGLFLQAATLALGRQVGCSSTLGCDYSCSSLAPWAPSLHL